MIFFSYVDKLAYDAANLLERKIRNECEQGQFVSIWNRVLDRLREEGIERFGSRPMIDTTIIPCQHQINHGYDDQARVEGPPSK